MTSSPQSPLLIAGTGALACLLAARLSASGTQVMLLGSWPEGLAALREHGVRLVESSGREKAFPVQAAASAKECVTTPYALVVVKSWQTERTGKTLAQCLAPDGLALTLQNGFGNREALARSLGAGRVAFGVTTAGANLLGPGQVRAAGEGVFTLEAHPRLAPLADMLRRAGFVVETSPDPSGLLWGKLVINVAINPLTALLGVTNGRLLEIPSARSLMSAAAREAAAVAVGLGVRLPYPDPVVAAETIARRTAENLSSMLQDIQRGAPTEIDAICGAIVQTGESLGIPTPINHTLWRLVQAKAESVKQANLQPTR
jgi:2-dehydropantoate 2-reductase